MNKRITFQNAAGQNLAGLLELPENPKAFALFAHCFTCGKDIKAATRISKALAEKSIAVLRFDFTGLGGSDGDFANSNFSSNVADLLAAADFLRREHQAPALLIGHSLGGAAILAAASQIPESRAVATIGAPAEADHILKQFRADIDTIQTEGESKVLLAGRPFTIRRQFLEDVTRQNQASKIAELGRALLVMHSPLDTTVAIDQAQKIYQAAMHPKSFISLDRADHLLSNARDAEYAANCIVTWAARYLPQTEAEAAMTTADTGLQATCTALPASASSATAGGTAASHAPTDTLPAGGTGGADSPPSGDADSSHLQADPSLQPGEVRVTEGNDRFLRVVQTREHAFLSDEPASVGGSNLGPDPYALLLSALGSCTSMTMRMYANRRKLKISRLDVLLRHRRSHGEACESCLGGQETVEIFEREIRLEGELTADERQKLLEIADKCPVHKTLSSTIRIETRLLD